MGCDGHLWRHQADLLKQMKQQARDGTLYEVIQLPVLLWRVKTDSNDLLRNRRETGSGDYGNNGNNGNNDEDYDEDYDYDGSYYDGEGEGDDNEPQTELPPNSIIPSATLPRGMSESEQEHPHRHHHGEEAIDSKVIIIILYNNLTSTIAINRMFKFIFVHIDNLNFCI